MKPRMMLSWFLSPCIQRSKSGTGSVALDVLTASSSGECLNSRRELSKAHNVLNDGRSGRPVCRELSYTQTCVT